MPGIDEEMRDWSLCATIEHNAIVNRSITAIVTQLVRGQELHGDAVIDPKHDVLPTASVGAEALSHFQTSIDDHLREIEGLPELRGSSTFDHPVFGTYDAAMWHGMFGFHLRLHLPQAKYIVKFLRSGNKTK